MEKIQTSKNAINKSILQGCQQTKNKKAPRWGIIFRGGKAPEENFFQHSRAYTNS